MISNFCLLISRRRRVQIALLPLVALLLLGAAFSSGAATSTFTFETNYVGTGIDQWGSTSDGYANSTTYQNFFGTQWDEKVDFGGFSYGLFGEKYGFKGNAYTDGKVGLDVYFKATTGSVDVHLANTVNLVVSDLDYASGATGTIHVDQNQLTPTSGNKLTSIFPTVEFSVDATFQIDAGIRGEFAYGVGSTTGSIDLADIKNVIALASGNPLLLLTNPFDTKLRLLSYNLNNSHDVTIGVSVGSLVGDLGLEIPVLNLDSPAGLRIALSSARFMPEKKIGDYTVSLNTEVEFGSLVLHSPYALDLASGSGLVASGHQDQIIGLAVDPIGLAVLAAGYPINPLAPKITIPGTPIGVEATLLEAQIQLDVGLNQTLKLTSNTYVRLLSNYVVGYSINGSQTIYSSDLQYLLPEDGSDFDIQIVNKPNQEDWTLTPSVYARPTLDNTLDLNFSSSLQVTAGALGLVYGGLIPIPVIPALYDQNFPFGDLGDINLIDRTINLGNLAEFQQVYRSLRQLVGGAPQNFSIGVGEYIVDNNLTGTFKAQSIAGTLNLTNSVFNNITRLSVPGTFNLNGPSNLAGAAGLDITGTLKIDKGSQFFVTGAVDADGKLLRDSSGRLIPGFVDANGLVSSGNFNIAGRFSYDGANIDTIGASAAFRLTGDPADPTHWRVDNGGANAFAHLRAIDGTFVLTDLTMSTDQSLINHGTLGLLGSSTFTAPGYDSNAAANLVVGGGSTLNISGGTFGRLSAGGALTDFKVALGDVTGGKLIYTGAGITSNAGTIILSGTRPTNGYFQRKTGASTFEDGLATLSSNTGTLGLANGATQTLTGNFANSNTLEITMPSSPAVPVAPFTTLTVGGGVTNSKDIIVDGGRLAAASYTQTSTGLLQLTRGAEVNLTGAIGGLSGSGTTLGAGKWSIDGTVRYNGNPFVTIGADTDVRISGAGHGFALTDSSNAYRNFATNNGVFALFSGATATSTAAFTNANQLTIGAGSSFTTRGLASNTGNISVVQTGSYDTTGGAASNWTSANSLPLTAAGLLTGSGTTNIAGTLTFSGPAPAGLTGSPLTGVAAGTTLAINHTSLYSLTDPLYTFNEALISLNPSTGAVGNGFANFSTVAGTLVLGGGSATRTDASLSVISGGSLTVAAGSTLQVAGANFSVASGGTLSLPGNLILGGGAFTTSFAVPADFAFSGTTQLGRQLVRYVTSTSSYVETAGKGALSSAGTWTNNGNITGVGKITGQNIKNNGVIYATGGNFAAGDALVIDNSAGTGRGTITNTGNIGSGGNALYSSRLTITNMDVANFTSTSAGAVSNGQIFASSAIDLSHVTVAGGFVTITGTGRLSLLDTTLGNGTFVPSSGITMVAPLTLTAEGAIDILNNNGGSSTLGGSILLKPSAVLTVKGDGTTGATLNIASGSTFRNTGTIRLEEGANFTGGTITNESLIKIAGGRTGSLANIDNTGNGVITLAHGTNLQMTGTFSNAGRIELSGEAANALPNGVTISHSAITLLGNTTLTGGGLLQLGGYNTVGTAIASNGNEIRTTDTQWRNGSIDLGNVTITGTTGNEVLTLSNQTLSGQGLLGNGMLSLVNDTNGTIRVLGNGSSLTINTNSAGLTNRGTLDVGAGATMRLTGGTFHSFTPAAGGASAILAEGRYRVGGTLIIDGLTNFDNAASIVFGSPDAKITDQSGNVRAIINNLASGSLEARNASYTFPTSAGATFTNAGSLIASTGGMLTITGDYFTNFANHTLTGGSYDVTGTLKFKNADIVTNAANITLRGTTPQIQDLNGNNALIGFANNNGTFSVRDNGTYTLNNAVVPTFNQRGLINVELGSTLDFGASAVNNVAASNPTYWIGGTLKANNTFSTAGTGITLFGNAAQWRVGSETLPMNIGTGGRLTFAGGFEGNYSGGYTITNNGLWEIGSGSVVNATGQTIRSGGYAKFGTTTDYATINGGGITRIYSGATDDGTQNTGTFINNFPRALYVDRLRVSGGGTLDANGTLMFGPSGRLELRQATFSNSLADTNILNTNPSLKGEISIVGGIDLSHALNLNGSKLDFSPAAGFPIKISGITFYLDNASFSGTNVSHITLGNNAQLLLRNPNPLLPGTNVLKGFTRNSASITLTNTAGYLAPIDDGVHIVVVPSATHLELDNGLINDAGALLAINEHSKLTLGGALFNKGTVNVITTIPEDSVYLRGGSSITMEGDLTNYGTITTSGGKIITKGNFINGNRFGGGEDPYRPGAFSGEISVYGDFTNAPNSTFSGYAGIGGNFYNYGTITNASFGVGGEIQNYADLTMSRFTFSSNLTVFPSIYNGESGTLRLSGTISNSLFGPGAVHAIDYTALRGDNTGLSGHLIVDSGAELDISADTQLGTGLLADVAINGTLTLQTATLNAARPVTFNDGSFLQLYGTSSILGPVNVLGSLTIKGGVGSGSVTLALAGYNNTTGLTIQNTSVTAVTNGFTLSQPLAGNGNLTMRSGFFADGSTNLDLNAGATLTGTITMAGDFSNLLIKGNTFAPNVVSDGDVRFFGNPALTYDGVIGGAADVTLLSGAQLTYTRAQTYTGLTTINAGTSLTLGGFTGSVAGSIANAGTLIFARNNDFTLGAGSNISGNGSITQAGTGRITILDASFLRNLTVTNGTVSIGDGSSSFGGTLPTATNNSHLIFNHTGSITTTVAGTGDIVNNAPGDLTLTISGANSNPLLHTGTGKLSLPANQTYTGATSVQGTGILEIFADSSLGAVPATFTANQLTMSNGSTLRSSGFDVTLNANRGLDLGNVTFDVAGSSLTLPNPIGGGLFTKTGFGTLNLVRDPAQGLALAINQGSLRLDNLGVNSNLGLTTTAKSTTLTLAGTGYTSSFTPNEINGRIVIESGSYGFTGKVNAPTGSSSLYDGVVSIGDNASLISISPNNEFYSIAGINTGKGSFTAGGGLGTTIATNVNVASVTVNDLTLVSNNFHATSTTLNNGTLRIGQANQPGSFGNTTTLTLTGISNTINVPNENSSFTIFGGVTNSGGLFTKSGPGTLTLDGSGTISSNISVTGGNLFLNGAPTLDGVVSGAGGIFVAGKAVSDRITFTKNQTYLGTTFITVGELMLGNGGTTGSVEGEINTGNLGPNYSGVAFNRSGTYTVANTITGRGYVRQASTGMLVINSSLLFTDAAGATPVDYIRPLIVSQGTIRLDDGAAGLGKITNGGALVFNNSSALTLDPTDYLGSTENISGAGTVTQLGTGTTTLGGTNTYTGLTTITHGTIAFKSAFANAGGLNVGSDGKLSLTGVGTILGNLANAGIVALDRNDDHTIAFTTTGSGTIRQNGSGIVTLGSLNHTNGFDIANAAGTLRINVSNTNDIATFSNALHGAGTFSKWGSGTLIMTAGTDGNLGRLHVEEGKLRLTSGSYAAPITLEVATALEIAGNISHSNPIDGVGQVKVNSGTFNLYGAATHTGGTSIASGATLALYDGGSLTGSIADSGLLSFNYSDSTPLDDSDAIEFATNVSGSGAMLQQGARKVTLTGANTLTGVTTIASGSTLALGAGGSITGPVTNLGTYEILTGVEDQIIRPNIGGGGTVKFTGTGKVFTSSDLGYTGTTLVGAGSTFEFRNANTNTLSTLVTGAGNFLRSGAGTLVVKGYSTLAGTVTNGAMGALQFGDGVTDGAISGVAGIVNQGTLVFKSPSANATFNGQILDPVYAGIVQQSGGMLTLNGGVQADKLIVDAGHVLNLGNGATLDAKIRADGTFYNLNTGNFTLTKGLTGASTGRYVQSGNGTLTVGGTSDFSGTLVAGDYADGGTIYIPGSATARLDRIQAASLTNFGNLTITGNNERNLAVDPLPSGFTVNNQGTLTLGNGGTTGTLGGSINSPGTLVINYGIHPNNLDADLNNNVAYEYGLGAAVKISGNGIIKNIGAGTLRISDDGAGGVVANSFQALNGTIDFERPIAGLNSSVFSSSGPGTFFLHDGSYANRIVNDGTLKTQGVVTLTNTFNTYAGAINITKFSANSSDSLTLGGSAGTIGADQTIGSLQGAGNFFYTGSGKLTLTNGSTLTGALTTAGNRISSGGSLSSPITFSAGNGTLEFTNSAPATLAGSLSGATTFRHLGTGALTVDLLLSGSFEVTSGALLLGANGSISQLAISNHAGASFALSGHDTTLTKLSGGGALGGNIALGSNTLTVNQDFTRVTNPVNGSYVDTNVDTTYGGAISGTGKLVKQGLGQLELTGTNTFSGGVEIQGGTIALNGSMNSAGGYLVKSAGTLAANSAANFGSGAATITLNGGRFQALNAISLSASQTIALSGGGKLGGDFTVNSTIGGSGTLTIDGGRVLLNGSAYQGGATHVQSGTLAIGSLNAVDHANTTFGGGSTFDVNGIEITPANWTQAITLEGATLMNGSSTPVTFSHALNVNLSLGLAGTGSSLTFSGALVGSDPVAISSSGIVNLTTPSAARINSLSVSSGTLSTPLAVPNVDLPQLANGTFPPRAVLTSLSYVSVSDTGTVKFTGALAAGGYVFPASGIAFSNGLDVGGDSSSLIFNTTGGALTINSPLYLTEKDSLRRGVALIGGSGDIILNGALMGELSLTKVGSGNLTLASNLASWNNANSGARLGVREGTLTTTTALLRNRGLVVENTGILALSDAITNDLQLRTLAGNGTLALGDRNLVMAQANNGVFTGALTTTGSVTHNAANGFPFGPSGGTQTYGTLSADTLTVNSGNVVITGQLNVTNLNVIPSGAGGSLTTTLIGFTTNSGTRLNGPFTNIQGDLKFTGGEALTGNSGNLTLLGPSATVKDGTGASIFTRNFTNTGTITLQSFAAITTGASFTNTGNFYAFGASGIDGSSNNTTFNQLAGNFVYGGSNLSGQRFNISGGTVDFNAGTFRGSTVNGSRTAAVNPAILMTGGKLISSGFIFGGLAINGGTLSPGGEYVAGKISIDGGIVLGSGGTYAWDIADATGSAGSGWDFLDTAGNNTTRSILTVTATAANPFLITPRSTTGGNITNFDPAQNYTWALATVKNSIVGFDNTPANAGKFSIANADVGVNATGNFGVGVSGDGKTLELAYNWSHVFTNETDLTEAGDLAANGLFGGLTKSGAGTLTVSGNNTYNGTTKINGGTVVPTNANAFGNGGVVVASGGRLSVPSGTSIANKVTLAGGTFERTLTGDLAHAVDATSSGGLVKTTASILVGNSADPTTLVTSFSPNTSHYVPGEGEEGGHFVLANASLHSDLYSLSGTGTNAFVLQLSFISPEQIYAPKLVWLDPSSNSWVNAVDGNTGNNASFAQTGYSGSFDSFQSTFGTNLGNYMGAWGAFIAADTTYTWAVLNHNSTFAVTAVPEPTTWGIFMAIALAGVVLARRRKLKKSRA